MTAVPVLYKTHADESQGMEFVLSDATVDRYSDSISADGWDLQDFKKNPIALFNHDADFPIGRWGGLSVRDGGLRGRLTLAPEGTSARIDEIRKLVDAGILRAVSVGFIPIESKPMTKGSGTNYLKSILVETSLVSVPANPNALAVARSLKISDATQDIVFRAMTVTTRAIDPATTVNWQGTAVPVERFVRDGWRGEKLYRY